jgi:hypothetical protein
MAHFAQIDNNNLVTQVIVVANEDTADENGNEVESIGQSFCADLLGGGTWVQTSYNANFRKHYAGIGYTYSLDIDAFVSPQPFPSWSLDANAIWQAPIPIPDSTKKYRWDEDTTNWIEVT